MDNSVIDVTGEGLSLTGMAAARPYVPYWKHQYVHSYSEIEGAGNEQRRFYKTYKANFLSGIYMDIQGNTNYAFILLFDLDREYENHKDIARLEQQLNELGTHYPKTKTYGLGLLIKKLQDTGDDAAIERIRRKENYYTFDDDYWKLGSKFKAKLNLSNEDVALLNKLSYPDNNFFNIEFCGREIVKFYLSAIKRLDEKYRKESSSLDNELLKIAGIVADEELYYRQGSDGYKYLMENVITELQSNIFRHCENTVREFYGNKRKLNTDIPYTSANVKAEYSDKLVIRLQKALAIYAPTIAPPDRTAEIDLNAQNPLRWKFRFDEIIQKYDGDPKKFVSDIVILGTLNKRNPALENIFYEASKFMAEHEKESSLKLYIYYLHYNLRSAKFDDKQLTKTIQKKLFATNEQIHDFQIIVSNLINDKDLENALIALPKVYAVKRKKIQLDRDAIRQVNEKHADTVELLNEYLKDEYEDDTNIFKTEEINDDEIVMAITSKSDTTEAASAFDSSLNFTQIQQEVLEMFAKANLSVIQQDVDVFARSKGVFKNQLIESLNELCYDTLDDVLIEEEDEYYTINENYYQTITAK
ncbi:tellurite resistance TerB C-terminal domain-containing protein [Flavobacterium sp. DGU11]|uniref:Tellurite resistance TerB C-terminal domain-containing protein n=1 Tax=Flavobacterium arundinis TaxID=3139143 RepID=A0ABU9HYC5_9FLAO